MFFGEISDLFVHNFVAFVLRRGGFYFLNQASLVRRVSNDFAVSWWRCDIIFETNINFLSVCFFADILVFLSLDVCFL